MNYLIVVLGDDISYAGHMLHIRILEVCQFIVIYPTARTVVAQRNRKRLYLSHELLE